MTGWKRRWLLLLGGLIVVVGLPLVGHWSRRRPESACALDGMPIDPVYRVEVIGADGLPRAFCCLRCAQVWLRRQPAPPRAVTVTDEVSGERLDAGSAWYVRSFVVTTPTTGNRIHVFRHRTDAEKHAAAAGGVVLPESESPFPH
jgi:hypothetical protein